MSIESFEQRLQEGLDKYAAAKDAYTAQALQGEAKGEVTHEYAAASDDIESCLRAMQTLPQTPEEFLQMLESPSEVIQACGIILRNL